MAIIATFSNATELAAEIEVRNRFLQALKEGKLPSFEGTVQEVAPPTVGTQDAGTGAVGSGPMVPAITVPTPPTLPQP